MSTGFSRSPKLLKGAIIQFNAQLLMPVPNIIVFQYNPETMSRSISPWAPPESADPKLDPKVQDNRAQPYDPVETFTLGLELDATDDLEYPLEHPIAVTNGIADRLAALEMLLYPAVDDVLLNTASNTLVAAGTPLSDTVVKAKRLQVPIILFFFGPGRILPVRITTFSVDEQAYSPTLSPLRAKVSLGLKVLDPTSLVDDRSSAYKLAVGSYKYTVKQKQALATARFAANAVDSITSLLPF